MTVFADSSALVKRYADEDGSDLAAALDGVVVSAVARVEVVSALWRKTRAEGLRPSDAMALAGAFGTDWATGTYAVVAATADVLDGAVALLARHPMRALDAVQLASAGAAREVAAEVTTFACFDRGLRTAAGREGWTLVPPD